MKRSANYCYQKDATKIAFTAGFGDFLGVESTFPDPSRITDIYWATRKDRDLIKLLEPLPEWSHVRHHICWTDWSDPKLHFAALPSFRSRSLVKIPEDVEDFGIVTLSVFVDRGDIRYHQSRFALHTLADLTHLDLPEEYVILHAYTNDNRDFYPFPRNFTRADWAGAVSILERRGLPGVLVGTGTDFVPDHPLIRDLTGKTTLLESLEMAKQAKYYVGVDSCISVMSALVLPGENLKVRCVNTWVTSTAHRLYYPTHEHPRFLVEKIS